MQHPEILVVPILMLADYFLTILGATLYKRGFGKHVRHESYELNPVWRRSVDALRWLNPRHLLLTAGVTVFLIAMSQNGELRADPSYDFVFGLLVAMYLIIVGRHLGNILAFSHAIKHPDDLSGEARLGFRFTLRQSRYQLLPVALPLAMLAVCVKSALTWGCFCAPIALAINHFTWERKYMKQLRKAASLSAIREEPSRPPPITSGSS